eukprot:SAG22_NODE_682_length_7924_cov_25.432460_1_plen_114_part_00
MTPEGEVTGIGLVDGYDKVRNLYCIVTPNGVMGVPPPRVLSLTGAIGKWVNFSDNARRNTGAMQSRRGKTMLRQTKSRRASWRSWWRLLLLSRSPTLLSGRMSTVDRAGQHRD